MQRTIASLLIIAGLAFTGCDSGNSSGGGKSEMDRMAEQLERESAAKKKAAEEAAAQAAATPAPEPEPEQPQVVELDGRRGKPREETINPLRVAAHAYVSSMDRLTEVQIRKGMDLYKATNGHYPKTHEEYMQKIIAEGEIQLPELEPGYEYWYNPEDPLNIYQRPIGSGEKEVESP